MTISEIKKIELCYDVLILLKNRGLTINDRIDILNLGIKSLSATKWRYKRKYKTKEKKDEY